MNDVQNIYQKHFQANKCRLKFKTIPDIDRESFKQKKICHKSIKSKEIQKKTNQYQSTESIEKC